MTFEEGEIATLMDLADEFDMDVAQRKVDEIRATRIERHIAAGHEFPEPTYD